ncbi:hypothetical protein D3C78_1827860 [compost metagenome]
MVAGFRDLSGPGIQRFVALGVGAGDQFLTFERCHRRLIDDLAYQSRTGAHVGSILLGFQVIEQDARRLSRVGAVQRHAA